MTDAYDNSPEGPGRPGGAMEVGFRLAEVMETSGRPFLVLDTRLRIEQASASLLRTFGLSGQIVGRPLFEAGGGEWARPDLRRLLEEILPRRGAVAGYRLAGMASALGERTFAVNARVLGTAQKRILLVFMDVTERERDEAELAARSDFGDQLADCVHDALLVLNRDLRVVRANRSFYESFRVAPGQTLGRPLYEVGTGQWDVPDMHRLLEEILPRETTCENYCVEQEIEGIGPRLLSINARHHDRMPLVLIAIRDLTDWRASVLREKALVGELQHRVKNILASVSALARQMSKHAETVDDFMGAFEERLYARARTEDLLVSNPDDMADLADLIRLELEALGAREDVDFSLQGPPVRVPPKPAQVLGMVFHELASNAAKYGALKHRNGTIGVEWRRRARRGAELEILWRERGVTLPRGLPPKGFGSQIIERSVPYVLHGDASLAYAPDGLLCRLTFPLLPAWGI